jgi:hypothetical protein
MVATRRCYQARRRYATAQDTIESPTRLKGTGVLEEFQLKSQLPGEPPDILLQVDDRGCAYAASDTPGGRFYLSMHRIFLPFSHVRHLGETLFWMAGGK